MKKIVLIFILISFCFSLSSCDLDGMKVNLYFGFQKDDYIVLDEKSERGFHGDGFSRLILDCSENTVEAHKIVDEWKKMPLSENLQLIMYGGEKDGKSYGFYCAEEAHWPMIVSNGVYKFVDENSDDESDDTNLFNRSSFNFMIALYDLDTDILYFYEMDT